MGSLQGIKKPNQRAQRTKKKVLKEQKIETGRLDGQKGRTNLGMDLREVSGSVTKGNLGGAEKRKKTEKKEKGRNGRVIKVMGVSKET